MKKIAIAAVLLITSAMLLSAIPDIRIGTIRWSEVISTFLQDMSDFRQIEEAQNALDTTIAEAGREIDLLEEQKFEAQEAGDDLQTSLLEARIEERLEYLKAYKNIQEKKIARLRQEVLQGSGQRDTLSTKIYDAVKAVADRNGYSVVLDADSASLIYGSPEVDITAEVIQEIKNRLN